MFLTDQPILDALIRGAVLSAAALIWVVVLIRINGLRSLSKMTNFDFVMTIALGSLIAGAAQASKLPEFLQIMAGMAALFVVQNVASRMRRSSRTIESVMQNNPAVLMKDGEIFEDVLKRERMARGDLIAKLREANVLDPSKVRMVVLETTGDVSVLHGDKLDDMLVTDDLRDTEGTG